MEDYAEDLIIIRYHAWWPSSSDPFYDYNRDENEERIVYYPPHGDGYYYTPYAWIDGYIPGGYNYSGWESLILYAMTEDSPIEITLLTTYDSPSRSGDIIVAITGMDEISETDLKLRIALIENDIYWPAPNGREWHNQTFRDMIPDTEGTPFSLSQGETVAFIESYQCPEPLVPENSEIVVFVQDDDTRKILQGAKIPVSDPSYTLTPFDLIDPIDSSIIISDMPKLTWHGSNDLDSGYTVYYGAYWDESADFLSPGFSGEITDTTYIIISNLQRSQSYHWKILAYNYHAAPRWSEQTFTFYIDGFPSMPEILYPENGANADSTTYLVWLISTDPDSVDAVSYSIHVDDDPEFGSPEIDQPGLTSGLLLDDAFAIQLGQLEGFENLQEDQTYYWRVRADDNYGLSSEWTPGPNYFIFIIPAQIPTLSEWGLIILALLLLSVGTVAVIRGRQAATTMWQSHH